MFPESVHIRDLGSQRGKIAEIKSEYQRAIDSAEFRRAVESADEEMTLGAKEAILLQREAELVHRKKKKEKMDMIKKAADAKAWRTSERERGVLDGSD